MGFFSSIKNLFHKDSPAPQEQGAVSAPPRAEAENAPASSDAAGFFADSDPELALALRELEVDSIPVNFLNPIPGTPLEHAPGLDAREALAVIALFRLVHPGRDIVVCGGRARALGQWENSLFFAGANGLMVGDYLTVAGSPFARDMAMLQTLGLISHA